MSKTITRTLIALTLIIIVGTGIFIWKMNSSNDDKFPDEVPGTSTTVNGEDAPLPSEFESSKDPAVQQPETSTQGDNEWGQENIDKIRDTLYGDAELTDEAELEAVLEKYDSYELTWEGHNQWTNLDGKTYSAMLNGQSYTVTVTYLEEGLDIVETMDMPNYEVEEPQVGDTYSEEPDWKNYPINVDTSKEAHTPDYTTRTKINCAIEQTKQEYDTDVFEVVSFGWSDEENAYVAKVLVGLQTVHFIEDADGNLYRYFGDL